jgi:hypothetical protein
LRSIVSLQRTVSTPSLVDFSRASPLDLFEQPAERLFSSLPDYFCPEQLATDGEAEEQVKAQAEV